MHAVLRVQAVGESLWRVNYSAAQFEIRDPVDWQGQTRSEHDKSLADVAFNVLLLDSDDVETDSLGERAALADGDDIADSGTGEGRRQMRGHVVVSLLEPVVLLDVVQVVASDDDRPRHFASDDNTPVAKKHQAVSGDRIIINK